MGFENQLGVAALSVLGALLLRWIGVPRRWTPVTPLVLSMLIVACFGELETISDTFRSGLVGGLFANGFLFLLMGTRNG
ncbi:MAG: hypothetical protein J4F39_07935 [Candidatus Latescibacteria bacterium]|nr:hypothetical protein [Candidatus Latescibacterota bacterium]